ncbi:hypothetical protein B0T26DRAFT_637485 [Lasiosphaeria miniovina]|uniref:FAD-binding PCMH-type domain-containing protein n=1 Tax=Lasiosphaeria miniovina TaxID=1954250 RepID=A0AA40B6Y1_9PEZI|nr:uncharacterized protein B0T26DRAFT_637485 [Lasiosphaeria miniovina]KAK0728821.1 hypothetical protein B0T26DRAFT_637485 [Lasiosphaeria miniovina]
MAFYFSLLGIARLISAVTAAAALAPEQRSNKPLDLCRLVGAHFPGKVWFTNSSEYVDSQESYYTLQERELNPSCVFRPARTADVSAFVKLVAANDRYPKNLSKPLFAVRSGGHTLWSGAANVDGGITVDMRGMNSFGLSADKKTASIGGGSNFIDVYPQLVPHNLTVLGARMPGVAAGGFLTGGGKNFLARKYGFACDNIFSYEVVLASGEVVYASASQNQDLWLALKGGSNNFGIITRFDVATHPLLGMWGGIVGFEYTPDTLSVHAQAFSDWMRPENVDELSDVAIILGFVNGSFFIEDSLFYSAPVVSPPVFAEFTKLPGVTAQSLELRSVAELVIFMGSILPATIPRSFELVYAFYNPDAATYLALFQTWQAGIQQVQGVQGLQIQYLVQPMPVTNGTNSLGLPPHQPDITMVVLTAAWDNTVDDDTVTNGLQAIVTRHEAILDAKKLNIGYKYLNYADVTQNPISTYGAANVARLRAVSRKYDPTGFFQARVPGYKLPKK